MPLGNNFLQHNQQAWDAQAARNSPWSQPVDSATIAAARAGQWQIHLTPGPLPAGWLDAVHGKRIVCLAGAGGQQAPVLAAAGARAGRHWVIDADYLTRFLETNILIIIIFPVVQTVPMRERGAHTLPCPWKGAAGEEVALRNCVVFLQSTTSYLVPCYIRVLLFRKG